MGLLVCAGAMLQCSFGAAPCTLQLTPGTVSCTPAFPAATIMDYKPFVNIATFGMCNSILNPTVASATAAKLGVFTPMPCTPATAAPWIIGQPNVLIGTFPALNKESILLCSYMGIIQITTPGQTKTQLQFPAGAGAPDMGAKLAAIKADADKKAEAKQKEIDKEVEEKKKEEEEKKKKKE